MPTTQMRDRIIRYTYLDGGILSRFDPKRNILEIDRIERERLGSDVQNLLDSSTLLETVVVSDILGTRFVETRLARG